MAAEKQEEKADSKLKDLIDGIKKCVDAEEAERGKMLDDLRFATLDQWPTDIRNEREGDVKNGPRPCLTLDQVNQYIVQILNDLRQGKPGIKVRPVDDAADVQTAKILQGLVRSIEDQSSADIAYMMAAESMIKIGLGYFRITTEYVGDESKDQEIVIKPIPNTFSTYLGPHVMPDGSDAEEGYIVEQTPTSEFKARYPKAKADKAAFDNLGAETVTFFRTEETITVVERFYITKEYEELLFLADGSTVTRADYDSVSGDKPEIQDTRTKTKRSLHWCKGTGAEILEERDLPGKYIPIIEVVGRETLIDGVRHLWGVVRPAKDSLRMYNYWASTITEKIALAPKAPFIGAVGQFVTKPEKWAEANKVNHAYLEYDPFEVNGNALPAPQRQAPAPIEVAMVQQLALIKNDVKAALGMYKAAMGESESQQSGRAILALQRESDTGTYHFGANLGVSIRHAGRVIVDMIPHYYDAARVVRILGEDGEIQTAHIDPTQEVSHRQIRTADGIKSIYNPGVGKYDVTITTGPSYNTKRMEAASTFVELSKGATDPGSAAVMRYLTVKNSDAAYSDEAAKMLKALLPPQVLEAMAQTGAPMPPEAQAKMAQAAHAVQAMQQKLQEAEQEVVQLKAGAAVAQAKIAASHEEKMGELNLEHQVESERARLARERATEELMLKRQTALDEAALKLEIAKLEAKTKIDVAELAANATLQAAQISAASRATGTPS